MTPLTIGGALAGGWASACLALRVGLRAVSVERENYRGVRVASGAGVLLGVPLLFGGAVAAAIGSRTGVVASGAGVAFGILGALDDRFGAGGPKGLRGHLGALLHGRPTTGLAKLLGGAATGVAVAVALGARTPSAALLDGALVALSANLANLLDLRPGRTVKTWALALAALAAASPPVGVAVVLAAAAGGVAAWLPSDLRERAMLGDAGANLLGATLGAAAVASLGPGVRAGCLVVLGPLTAASEFVSFTRVIERVAPLRALDRLGRRTPTGRQNGH